MQNVSLKSLQEDAADYISRRHFQMYIFLALYGLNDELVFQVSFNIILGRTERMGG